MILSASVKISKAVVLVFIHARKINANKKPQPKLGSNLPCLMIEPRAVAIRFTLEKIRFSYALLCGFLLTPCNATNTSICPCTARSLCPR